MRAGERADTAPADQGRALGAPSPDDGSRATTGAQSRLARASGLDNEVLVFTALRGLTLVGGVAALFMVPVPTEHEIHVAPLVASVAVYKAMLVALLVRWRERARDITLATLAADLGLVFLLIWFTGGGQSHFYLLFHLLVALDAYYFGPAVGVLAATLASAAMAMANWLVLPPVAWVHIGSRAGVLGLLALALGHVASRERRARAAAERRDREMRESAARLARAEQLAAVGRLSAKMAHEVRNPLGAINLNAEMLEDIVRAYPGPANGEAQELVHGIREEIRALAALTDEYLVAARLPKPRPELGSLNALATDLADFLRPVAARQGVTLDLDLDEALPSAIFDWDLLRQAAHNLVRNAFEALPRGGRVTISTRLEDKRALLAVGDDGPGVSEEAAGRLFEPFFTTKPRGTGLGLSIASEIARQHGGALTWRNRSSVGAEFALRLPLEASDG